MPQDEDTYRAAGTLNTSGQSAQHADLAADAEHFTELAYLPPIENANSNPIIAPDLSRSLPILSNLPTSVDVQGISQSGATARRNAITATDQFTPQSAAITRRAVERSFPDILRAVDSLHQEVDQASNSSLDTHRRRNYNVLPPPVTRNTVSDTTIMSNPTYRELVQQYSSLHATIAQLSASPPIPVWPYLLRPDSPGPVGRPRDLQPHPRSRATGSLLRQAYGAEARGGTLERFMKEFEAEYKMACYDHNTAVTQLKMAGSQVFHSDSTYVPNGDFYIRNLLSVLQRYEKCATMLVERRDDFESAVPVNHVRGGTDTAAWFEKQAEKVETSAKKLKKDLRSLGILKKVQKRVEK